MLQRDRRSKRRLKKSRSNIIEDLNPMFIPSKSYKKSAPMTISRGASSIELNDILVRCKREASQTDKAKDVPNELTYSINVSSH